MAYETFISVPEDMRRVVIDGYYALQYATFVSPKRKSIQAYKDYAAPVYDWFNGNVARGNVIFDALTFSVAAVDADVKAAGTADLN